jgi:RNA polymerase sigma factor (sigma-70 family)
MSGETIDGHGSLTEEAALEIERQVRAIEKGDPEAEQAFVTRYMRPVRAMLLARSRNPDLAADLLQDVMIEAICALRRGQLRESSKLTQFVMGITRNLLNNHFRSSVRSPESLELPDDLPDLARATDPMEEQERQTQALDAISSLDPVDKTILQMTLVEGLKPGVIAKRLGLPSDVVRQRKVRAIRRVTDIVRSPSQTGSSGHNIAGRVNP